MNKASTISVLEIKVEDFNRILATLNLKIICAESITAGLIASTIGSVPGASAVLNGSIVTYQSSLKTKILGVKKETVDKYSAESAETTFEMVQGLVRLDTGADICLGITGVASAPITGYPVSKQVGQVYVAVGYGEEIFSFECILPQGSRNEIREGAVQFALKCVLTVLQQKIDKPELFFNAVNL